jgi:hypothetical protein
MEAFALPVLKIKSTRYYSLIDHRKEMPPEGPDHQEFLYHYIAA